MMTSQGSSDDESTPVTRERSPSSDDFFELLLFASKRAKASSSSLGPVLRDAKEVVNRHFPALPPVAEEASASVSCFPDDAQTKCGKSIYIIAWILRVLAVLAGTLIWMPLHVGLLQLIEAHAGSVPSWLESAIEPYSYLILAESMSALVTYYFVDPYLVLQVCKALCCGSKEGVLGCNQKAAVARLVFISIFSLFGTVLAAMLYLPIILELPDMGNSTYLGIKDFFQKISSYPVLQHIIYWLPNLLMHAYSGLRLSTWFVDFLSFFWRKRDMWLAYKRKRYVESIVDDPTYLNPLIRSIVAVMDDGSKNEVGFKNRLADVKAAMTPEKVLATVLYFRDRQSFVSRLAEYFSYFLLSIIIHFGTLSFYFASFRLLPFYLALVMIVVSVETLSQLSRGIVIFFKQLADLNHKVAGCLAAFFSALPLFLWAAYTSSGAVAEVYFRNTSLCLSNSSDDMCRPGIKESMEAEIFFNCFSLFVMNLDPVFVVFLLVQKAFLTCCQKNRPAFQKKLAIEDFSESVKGLLSQCSWRDLESAAGGASPFKDRLPLRLEVDERVGNVLALVFLILSIAFSSLYCFNWVPVFDNHTVATNDTVQLLQLEDSAKLGIVVPAALLVVGDFLRHSAMVTQKRNLDRRAYRCCPIWSGVFLPIIPNAFFAYVVFFVASNLFQLGLDPILQNVTQERERETEFFAQLLIYFIAYLVIAFMGDAINDCLIPRSQHQKRRRSTVSTFAMIGRKGTAVTEALSI